MGDLTLRLPATEARPERAGPALDRAAARPTAQTVARAQVAVAEAKVLSTETALQATDTSSERAGTRSTLSVHRLDRHWRNARTHTLHGPLRWNYAILGGSALKGVNPPLHA